MPQQKKDVLYQPRKFYLLHLKRLQPKKVALFQQKHQQLQQKKFYQLHQKRLPPKKVASFQPKHQQCHLLKLQLTKAAQFQLKHQQLLLRKFYQLHQKRLPLKKVASFQLKHQQLLLRKFYLLHLKILQQLKKDALFQPKKFYLHLHKKHQQFQLIQKAAQSNAPLKIHQTGNTTISTTATGSSMRRWTHGCASNRTVLGLLMMLIVNGHASIMLFPTHQKTPPVPTLVRMSVELLTELLFLRPYLLRSVSTLINKMKMLRESEKVSDKLVALLTPSLTNKEI